ncbi:MAG TPA: glycosyltransferase family 2 protein [Victivallales bacterium]|nr:glycosyltransferase family 2 protein [Victivallales bacterium]
MPPLFTIGITTYDRPEMLRECLKSLINQTFTDFEVIIGNDYIKQHINLNDLDIHDKRIRIINHERNLGEIKNMNYLLSVSSGKYFTWIADDDAYSSIFLESINQALKKFGSQPAIFTSYFMDKNCPENYDLNLPDANFRFMKGNDFLVKYLKKEIKLLGCCGVFDRKYLNKIGGMIQLGTGFSPYSDNILAIKSGALENIVYINHPLIFFRGHEQSISFTSIEIKPYISAQKEFLPICMEIFNHEKLKKYFDSNLYYILKWYIKDFFSVVRRSGKIYFLAIISFTFFILKKSSRIKSKTYRRNLRRELFSSIYRQTKLFIKNEILTRNI